jgi:4-carboxymuconolactone decarboxylase/3-oxoadipate enol-lactonase/4-carboxymuconolactone decarboxylase
MEVRREVLGDAHVDRAEARKTPFTEDFQALTRYAWGSVGTRPVLDRKSRSVAMLTALLASATGRSLRCTSARPVAAG